MWMHGLQVSCASATCREVLWFPWPAWEPNGSESIEIFLEEKAQRGTGGVEPPPKCEPKQLRGSRGHEWQFRRKAQGSIPQPEVPEGSSECAHECSPSGSALFSWWQTAPHKQETVFSRVDWSPAEKCVRAPLHSSETQEGYLSSDPSKQRAASRKKCLTRASECHTWGWSCPKSTQRSRFGRADRHGLMVPNMQTWAPTRPVAKTGAAVSPSCHIRTKKLSEKWEAFVC